MKRITLVVMAMAVAVVMAACTPNHNNPAGIGQGYPDDKPAADDAGP